MLNFLSVVDLQVITKASKHQVDIDNVQENARQVTHEYTVNDLLYLEMTSIYRKLDHCKQEPYRII